MYRIAVMPGDGVGPELSTQALRVLASLSSLDGFDYELVPFPHSAEHYRKTGETLGDAAVAELRQCDCLLFGAVGDPSVPSGLLEREVILGLSKQLDLWLGVRHAFLHSPALTSLKNLGHGDIDVTIIRDVTEGATAITGGVLQAGTPYEVALSSIVHTGFGVDRALRAAFALARRRQRPLAVIAQANVVAAAALWARRMDEIAPEFPTVEAHLMLPDHAANDLVIRPDEFGVIVTDLLLGGLFSDLVGGLVGGAGLIGSSRFNPDSGFGLYEPAHGSAPKYAGQDKVSPMATLNALAMLLEDRGEHRSATRLRSAIDLVLSTERAGLSARSGIGTTAATDLVLDALGEA